MSKYNNISSLFISLSLVLLITTDSLILLSRDKEGSVTNKVSILIFGGLLSLLTDKNDILLVVLIVVNSFSLKVFF